MVSKDFIFKKSVQGTSSVSYQNEEIYDIVSYQNFACHVTLATFKKENFNMWVTSGSYVGHIRIALWVTSGLLCGSVGLMGQQV